MNHLKLTNMIFFPFAIPVPAADDFAITTVQFEKSEISSSTSTTALKTIEDRDFNSLEELVKIKDRGLTTTTVSIREKVEESVSQQISDVNYYTEDYEIN